MENKILAFYLKGIYIEDIKAKRNTCQKVANLMQKHGMLLIGLWYLVFLFYWRDNKEYHYYMAGREY